MRKRRKSNLTKLKLRNSTRVLLVILSLVVFALSSANLYKALFTNTSTTTIEKDIYSYKNDFKSDYTINITTNPFIEEPSLPSGQTYVSDLISSIDMNMKYNYSASESTLINYNYKIDAVIAASYTDNGTEYSVWNKTYNLKISDNLQSIDTIDIDESVNIDYPKYHQEVNDFKQTLGMTVDAYLYVRLTVDTSSNINNQEVENEYVSDFSITVGDKIAIVSDKSSDTKDGAVKQEKTHEENNIDINKTVFSLIAMMISIYIIYFITCRTKKLHSIKNEFRLELNRILKSCQDRIVIVENKLEDTEETIIDVKDFGELIKLSEELYKPILCWISDDLNDEQAWFSIISNKSKYRFILKKSN